MTPSPPPLQRMLDAYDGFTRGERRLADFLLETPDALAVSSASEIAARAGVSKATAARFFRRLGYASFKVAKRDAVGLRGAPARAGARDAAQGAVERGPARLDLAQHLAAEVQSAAARRARPAAGGGAGPLGGALDGAPNGALGGGVT